ncbi:MAG: hypothetical protein QOD75_1151 [Blastocatellia bacterium]|jgi:hypothetical protein|nr:hypothetical protein [Blastocatellia bacterium]
MSKKLVSLLGAAMLALSVAAVTAAQEVKTVTTTTATKVVQNADGTWTVVEYPVGKEVIVDLTPAATLKGATGRATILRNPDGTTVKVNLTGVPADMATLNLYAVDPTGTTTLLGPLAIENGVGTYVTTNPLPLERFMIIASPESDIATFTPDLPVLFRSVVPTGLAVVPLARKDDDKIVATGEKVSAASSPYAIPMLGIPSLPADKESEVHVNFANDTFHAQRTTIFITPNYKHKGTTRVKAKFHELTGVPTDAFLTLWAVAPDGTFTRLGSTPNSGKPNVAEIDTAKNNTNVTLSDFGLFLTTEPSVDVSAPSGPVILRIIK